MVENGLKRDFEKYLWHSWFSFSESDASDRVKDFSVKPKISNGDLTKLLAFFYDKR